MIQAMYAGISGMKAFKSDLDVIGNNIANVNTTGFKASRATFKDMLSQTLSGATGPSSGRGGVNPSQIGLGVTLGSIDVNNEEGPMQSTGRQSDLAIEGDGYFAFSDGSGVIYSRDGALTTDAQNNLVAASNGLKLLGWAADPATGVIDTSEAVGINSGIQIPVGKLSTAQQTSKVDLSGNLNASQSMSDPVNLTFNVYDSLGTSHKLSVNFTKQANTPVLDGSGQPVMKNGVPVEEATWKYDIFCPDVDPAVAVSTGNVTFNEGGHSNLDSVPISLTLANPNGSKQPLDIAVGMKGLGEADAASSAAMSSQDGLQYGTLSTYSIDLNGLISGAFTNGSTRSLGQLAVAQFNNPAGLTKTGNNMLAESPNSGNASIGLPTVGGRGGISAGFLEGSNVDLANEFANMIIAQRGFQANSRIITTSDEVLQELVQLKR